MKRQREGEEYKEKKDSLEFYQSRNRTQIRRKFIDKRHEQFRGNLIRSLQRTDFRQLLRNVGEKGANEQQLQKLLQNLTNNSRNVELHLELGEECLEGSLWRLFRDKKEQLRMEERLLLLQTLVHLTYYSEGATCRLLSEQLLDTLRKEVLGVAKRIPEGLPYFTQIMCFLLNLSSVTDIEFNLYLAESDFLPDLHSTLSQILHAQQTAPQLQAPLRRLEEYTLRLFSNLMHPTHAPPSHYVKLLLPILNSELLITAHCQFVLRLLSEALRLQGVWTILTERQDFQNCLANIGLLFDTVQLQCGSQDYGESPVPTLNPKSSIRFNALLIFLNQLHQEPQSSCSWSELVSQLLNGYMLSDFTLKWGQFPHSPQLRHALICYSNLSEQYTFSVKEILRTRNVVPREALLSLFSQQCLLDSPLTAIPIMKIWKDLIPRDPSLITSLLQMKMLQKLVPLWESEIQEILCALFDLTGVLLVKSKISDCLQCMRDLDFKSKTESLLKHKDNNIIRKAECLLTLLNPSESS